MYKYEWMRKKVHRRLYFSNDMTNVFQGKRLDCNVN